MKKRRLLSGSPFICLLGIAILSLSATAQTTAPNEWTWMGGSGVITCDRNDNCGMPGVYGTLGTPAAGNVPGNRGGASTWIDGNGNFWLFGGGGDDANKATGYLDDLWEFNPATSEWAWMGGSDAIVINDGEPGVYGTLGTPAAGNIPGGRSFAAKWTDKSGHLWLFGGLGSGGLFNDLWEFDPSTNEWTWMGGSSTMTSCANPSSGSGGDGDGTFGFSGEFNRNGQIVRSLRAHEALTTAATGSVPGVREQAATWTDGSGNFWLMGGTGCDANGNYVNVNDLWEFNPATNNWVLLSGSGTEEQPSVYGTLGVQAAGNLPGGRSGASSWADSSGEFWLFGGYGYDANNTEGYLNDLWKFNPSTNEWAWMGGSSTVLTLPGGGAIGGSFSGVPGVYGKLGTPAAGNVPGGRRGASNWTDASGSFWLFGGFGSDIDGNIGDQNDLWVLDPVANEWAWMGGSNTLYCTTITYNDVVVDTLCGYPQPGVYGTQGVPALGNVPGGRDGAASWIDGRGTVWLFGGTGDDLWEYQPPVPAATPAFSLATGTYATQQTVTISVTTVGATIYYTTDGTAPTTSSSVYSGPIIVASTETVEAIATASGYVTSAVVSATYTIPPDFTVAINPASISVQAGQSGTTTITVQDEGGFNSNVSFACSGLPAGAACGFAIETVPTPPGVTYTMLTVTTSATAAAVNRNGWPLLPGSALAVAFCCFGWKKQRRLKVLVLLAVSVAGLSLFTGCGGSSAPVQPVTSMVTVNATGGSAQYTATFSLTVY
jgi:N-acetylneuraminic acid mutarotase